MTSQNQIYFEKKLNKNKLHFTKYKKRIETRDDLNWF